MPKAIKRENVNKPKRVPVSGIRDIMTVYGKDPDFMYYWVKDKNENGSRIMKFKRGGYEFARRENDDGNYVIGEEAVYSSDSQGSLIRLATGDAEYSYLMRIPRAYYEEDQAAKEALIRETEDQIRQTGSPEGDEFGQYGTVS